MGFRLGELVGDRIGNTLREQRGAVEREQVLLDHPPHEVGDIGDVDAVAKTALEAVTVQQRHEELKVFLLAVVRCGRHQQEVARQGRQQLPEAVTLGVLDFTPEERRRHLMRLVAHDEIPAAIRNLQLLLNVFVARELIEARNHQVRLQEPVARTCSLQLVVRQDVEGQLEPAVQLILPLLGETAGTDDQTPLQIPARDQLLDEQPRHDRLAGARVIGEKKAKGLTGQHGFVDRGDLMGQGLDDRGVHGEHRVEEMRQADPLRLVPVHSRQSDALLGGVHSVA